MSPGTKKNCRWLAHSGVFESELGETHGLEPFVAPLALF